MCCDVELSEAVDEIMRLVPVAAYAWLFLSVVLLTCTDVLWLIACLAVALLPSGESQLAVLLLALGFALMLR